MYIPTAYLYILLHECVLAGPAKSTQQIDRGHFLVAGLHLPEHTLQRQWRGVELVLGVGHAVDGATELVDMIQHLIQQYV